MAFEVHFRMWLQAIYRLSASLSGLRITPSSLLWVGVGFFVSMLMRRFSPKHLAIPIIAVQTLVYATLLFSGTSYPIVMFHVAAGAIGDGFGIIVSSTMVVAQAVVPQEQVGAATSMTTLGRTLGPAWLTARRGLGKTYGRMSLLVALGSVVSLAEHLAVRLIGRAALAPRGHMVSVHLVKAIDALRVVVMTERTQRAVGPVMGRRVIRLPLVDGLLGALVEHADVEKGRVLFAAEHVLDDALLGGLTCGSPRSSSMRAVTASLS